MIGLVQGNTLNIPLADKSVQCIVTSPPYWGLRAYATGDNKHVELGSEPLHDCLGWATGNDCGECYICHMRQVARECWRVLRDDGVMFWNIADSYAGGVKGSGDRAENDENFRNSKSFTNKGGLGYKYYPSYDGLKPKDKCGIPERTALAFQADGWWWRSDIIWHKSNPMPESVTDRPTKSHEFIYLFTKAERYYWDAEAVREGISDNTLRQIGYELSAAERGKANVARKYIGYLYDLKKSGNTNESTYGKNVSNTPSAGRNLRDVWTISTHSYPGQHFATFAPELPRRCIKAGTSERGCCPKCGKGWVRVVKLDGYTQDGPTWEQRKAKGERGSNRDPGGVWLGEMPAPHLPSPIKSTSGWRPGCACDAGDPVPCIVLDPFSGAATTGIVARELGRHYIGLELSAEYLKQSRDRLSLTALDEWGGNGKAKDTDLSGLPMFEVTP